MMNWIIFILVVQVIHFLGTWKLYEKAGYNKWLALIPIYNAIVLMKINNRPVWWVVLLFIPVINLLMFPVIWIETAITFNRGSKKDLWLTFLSLGFYLFVINYSKEIEYAEKREHKPKTKAGDWLNSVVFAVIAATLVHTYFIQPFTIPTGSLEKSLLIGDFLFVSKFHYGARTPQTPLTVPMVHDTVPVFKVKSYLKKPLLPYFRLPGLQKIKRNDIVVFNWPADTVKQFFKTPDEKVFKPVDKKSNYVKRCVGIAGDTLSIIDGDIYIDGKRSVMPERAKPQFYYLVDTGGERLSSNAIYNKYKVRRNEGFGKGSKYLLNLDEENRNKIEQDPKVKSVRRYIDAAGEAKNVYPSISFKWNKDNYGPIYIPKRGDKITLNKKNVQLYHKIITEYEGNTFKSDSGKYLINNERVESYTIKQNYYWMMGDNRHNSEDSRFWGFVPEDHVVGKPVFIWFSWDSTKQGLMNKIRWDRLFTVVHGEGKPQSYLIHFLVFLVLYNLGKVWWKKRKQQKIS